MANAVQWIPDDQVSECPLCTQRFGLSKRKHHCRACGRVVCSSCSASRLKINNKEERVCDTCYDLLQHDNGRPVNESFLENKQVEASLKADLREKQQQEEWFRSFLTQVAGAAEDELPQLIANAAARWQSLCRLRGQEDQALQQLKLECLQLEGECREREAALAAGQKIVKALEQDWRLAFQSQILGFLGIHRLGAEGEAPAAAGMRAAAADQQQPPAGAGGAAAALPRAGVPIAQLADRLLPVSGIFLPVC
ncbi:unnamed protein product [Effrenium voratum]|nr:unnamed protein product [Effrenium voratum]